MQSFRLPQTDARFQPGQGLDHWAAGSAALSGGIERYLHRLTGDRQRSAVFIFSVICWKFPHGRKRGVRSRAPCFADCAKACSTLLGERLQVNFLQLRTLFVEIEMGNHAFASLFTHLPG